MSEEVENTWEERSRRSEEGRVLVGLGLIAVAVAYRSDLPKTFTIPLQYPPLRLDVLTLPVFDSAVLIFSTYAALMGIYFSSDISGLSYFWRRLSQRTGHAFLVGYSFLLFWSLTTELGWLLVPNFLAVPYAVVNDLSLFYITALIYDVVSDKWGRTITLSSRIAGSPYRAFKPYFIIEVVNLWETYRGKLPISIQRSVRRLGYYAGWRHTFNRRIRRAYLVMFPALIIAFFFSLQYELGQTTPSIATIEASIVLVFGMWLTISVMILVSREEALRDSPIFSSNQSSSST